MLHAPVNAPIKQKAGIVGLGSSTEVVTGVGFRPKALIMYWLPSDSTTLASGGYGVADGTTQFSTSFSNSASAAARDTETDDIVNVVNQAGTVAARASLQSFDADGFTLAVSVAGQTFGYLALG